MGSMLNVQSFRHVAGSLPTILDLLLPGIDPNDPSKTMHTAMLVLQTVSKIKISNITVTSDVQVMLDPEQDHPDIADSSQFNPSQPDSGLIVLESETFFADWALTYFQRVMGFFENLPEPQGKQEKTGGKLEESTINFLCASFDELCKAVSPELGSKMVDYFKSYISDNVRSNMVKAVELVSGSLSRGIQGGITFQSIYPLCDARIRAELEAGVASAPTMSTNSPSGPDLRLHWFMSIIVGICNNAGLAVRSILFLQLSFSASTHQTSSDLLSCYVCSIFKFEWLYVDIRIQRISLVFAELGPERL
jgi:proteasome activator subunit 4